MAPTLPKDVDRIMVTRGGQTNATDETKPKKKLKKKLPSLLRGMLTALYDSTICVRQSACCIINPEF